MLGSMMLKRRKLIGFTLIELMVVVALVAILLSLAAPSFTSTLARKRLEGVASELATDLHYARSEAMQRNASVGVIFGTNCYVIFSPVNWESAPLNCAAASGTGALKVVAIDGGTSLNFAPRAGQTLIAFDPVGGMALGGLTGTADYSGDVDATNSAGNWQIQARVTKVGRVKLCSPNNTITALATDCL
jgi:type IV fimbrial biogenesis protein FimT